MPMSKMIALLLLLGAILAVAPRAPAQSMPIGTIHSFTDPYPCSADRNATKFYAGMTCQDATVSCPGAADLGLTFGYIVPSVPKGTIVMFSGGGGTAPTEDGDNIPIYASAYTADHVVVQLEWDGSAWQDPSNGNGGSFLTAACRPATFLNYVNTALNPKNFTCAQGSSMGTAAIGYAMAWYGAASYLKVAELIAGPPASDIDVGCNPASPGPVTICSADGYCTLKTAPWTDRVTYPPAHASTISMWSGLPTPVCASNGVTQSELQQWAAMSIVDGSSSGYNPTFNYNATQIHGWLCTDTYKANSCNTLNCPNNTSAQGKLFYDAVWSAENQNPNLTVTGTISCIGAEGVDFGKDPDKGGDEYLQIQGHMETNCQSPQ
jgi:hypothetical protein